MAHSSVRDHALRADSDQADIGGSHRPCTPYFESRLMPTPKSSTLSGIWNATMLRPDESASKRGIRHA